MKNILPFALLSLPLSVSGSAMNISEKPAAKTIYSFEVRDIEGKPVKLEIFKGKVLLIVNVVSKCGFTPQYTGLEKLYKKFKDRGFVVLGFPANNFRNQEPGTDSEIRQFCKSNYGVTFLMFSKISVAGADKHPLYVFLTEKATNTKFPGEIKWNFDKFLIDKSGNIYARFDPREKPEDKQIVRVVKEALEKN